MFPIVEVFLGDFLGLWLIQKRPRRTTSIIFVVQNFGFNLDDFLLEIKENRFVSERKSTNPNTFPSYPLITSSVSIIIVNVDLIGGNLQNSSPNLPSETISQNVALISLKICEFRKFNYSRRVPLTVEVQLLKPF